MEKLRKLLQVLGPGFVTGASDDDPSGIATYSQTGALFGYSQLWTALFTFPFMTVIQEMCGRIGMVTGKGLSAVMRDHYPKPILYGAVMLLVIANTINIGADLGAMAASGQLLFNFPFVDWLLVLTALSLFLEIFVSYAVYSRYLKYLTISLFAYMLTAFTIKQPWLMVLKHTIIPHFTYSKAYLMNIVAILGTTISPYLFFWQASEEVEKEVQEHKIPSPGIGKPDIQETDIRDMRLDTLIGMFFSNLMMFFIIVTTASTLGAHGITNIDTAEKAAQALRPYAGDLAYSLFAAGIMGTGLLAVPVLAGSASYALSEAFSWRSGLYLKLTEAHGFYGVISIATIIGLIINFTTIPPFKMLYYTAILNGICAPPLMVVILLIANNSNIMGKFTNSRLLNLLGWIITVIMALVALLMLFNLGKPS